MTTKAERLARMQAGFAEAVPYNRALGVEIVDFEAELGDATVEMRLPYDPRFVGNPDTGVLHGGVITAAMDAACGASVFLALKEPRRIATLDLRIDYLGPATPERDVICACRCFRVTRQIAFTRGLAHHGDESSPIATATGTFVIFDSSEGSALAKRMEEA